MDKFKNILVISLLMLVLTSTAVQSAVPEGWENGWSEISTLAEASQYTSNPQVKLDSTGLAHVLWMNKIDGKNQIAYLTLNEQGQVVSQKQLTREKEWKIRNFKSVMDVNDQIHLMIEVLNNGDFQIWYKQLDKKTGNFVKEKVLADLERPIQGLNAAIDSNGNFHMIWADLRKSRYQIYYSKFSNNLATLVVPGPITDTPVTSVSPNFAVDSTGNIHLLWNEYDGVKWKLKYQMFSNDGKVISEIIDFGRSVEYTNNTVPQIGIDSNDQIYIAWIHTNGGGFGIVNNDLFFSVIDKQQNLLLDELQISDHFGDYKIANSPYMYIDSNDQIYLVWSDNLYGPMTNLYAIVAEDKIIKPQSRLAVVAENLWLPSLIVDHNGEKHLLFMEFDSGGKYNLGYMNSIHPAKINYLNRLGLDIFNPLASVIYRLVILTFFSGLGIIMNFVPLIVAFLGNLIVGRFWKNTHWLLRFLLMVSIILLLQNIKFAAFPEIFSPLYDLIALGMSLITVIFIGFKVKLDYSDMMSFVLLEVLWIYMYIFILQIPAGYQLVG